MDSLVNNNMKWITLKSTNLPIIALEIDRAIQVFNGLVERANLYGLPDDAYEVNRLRHQFQLRITQLDNYYREHSADQNVPIFQMLKLKLQKTLFQVQFRQKITVKEQRELQQNVEDSLFEESSSKLLDQPLFQYYENSNKKRSSIEKSQKSQKQGDIKVKSKQQKPIKKGEKGPNKYEINKNDKPVNLKKGPVKNVKTQIRRQVNQKKVLSPNVSSKIRQSAHSLKAPMKGTQTPVFHDESLNHAGLLQQMRKSSELKFTIKMTKNEYKQLLEVKRQMQQGGKL